MIDFPTGTYVGQAHTIGNRTWIWNGVGWEKQINRGQLAGGFVAMDTEITLTVTALPYPNAPAFYRINYV